MSQQIAGKKRVSSESLDTSAKRRRVIPHLIQGELCRLDKKFHVSPDKACDDEDGYDDGQGLRLQVVLGES